MLLWSHWHCNNNWRSLVSQKAYFCWQPHVFYSCRYISESCDLHLQIFIYPMTYSGGNISQPDDPLLQIYISQPYDLLYSCGYISQSFDPPLNMINKSLDLPSKIVEYDPEVLSMHLFPSALKGSLTRDFRLQFFSWISVPRAPEYLNRIALTFFENSRR